MGDTGLLETIRGLIAHEFAIESDEIAGATRLREDLDLDSLDIVAMAQRVEEATGTRIEDEELADLGCVDDVVRVVASRLEGADPAARRSD